MLLLGLTGGIGAGKSTAAARLVHLGASLVDADQLAREVVAAGTPGLLAIRERFGPEVLTSEGALDRPRLGQLVFEDELARRDLEAIIHPAVAAAAQAAFRDAFAQEQASGTPVIVVHDVPLLTELSMQERYDLVLVVQTGLTHRLDRLAQTRGMSQDEARSRIDAQASDAQRAAIADVLLTNDGASHELEDAIDQLWQERLLPLARERIGQWSGGTDA